MKKIPLCLLIGMNLFSCRNTVPEKIDRFALVNRHNLVFTTIDSMNSLTVGNGDFAFTADITGLQSFPEYYINGIPLGTLSNWGWHSYPNVGNYSHEQVIKEYNVSGKEVGYYHDFREEQVSERAEASAWLRENPHRINLGMLGLIFYGEDGQVLDLEDIDNPRQELNLWKGEISSYFEVEGVAVEVITLCHPREDMVSASITSELIRNGRLAVELRFTEADPGWKNTTLWGESKNHRSRIIDSSPGASIIQHVQDSTQYHVSFSYSSGNVEEGEDHRFTLVPASESSTLSFSCEFEETMEGIDPNPEFESTRSIAHTYWKKFWGTGGAVDFSHCTDPRSFELERRVVLSRYLTQVQCSGNLPPQETGLTFNSWHGKHHLEMHWWHGVHFALWQKQHILEKQMEYYSSIYQEAENLAKMQDYKGVRWPKMTGPEGITSPSTIGNYLIWQQPHFIYFAELLYQISGKEVSTLDKYGKLVFETAEFMASFPVFDSVMKRYTLAPPLIPAQERFNASTTINPAFELSYWNWALRTAIEWKKRVEAPVPGDWSEVLEGLSTISIQDSLYLFTEDGTDSYSNPRYLSDHPMVLGCMGMLPPSDFVDPGIFENTFNRIVSSWNWTETWGWDYPMVSMAAGALGKYEEAIDYLLLDVQKNTYLPNGHNYQDERLTLYLPGNGGLLTAIATMCTKDQFPKDGNWNVLWEDLNDF